MIWIVNAIYISFIPLILTSSDDSPCAISSSRSSRSFVNVWPSEAFDYFFTKKSELSINHFFPQMREISVVEHSDNFNLLYFNNLAFVPFIRKKNLCMSF